MWYICRANEPLISVARRVKWKTGDLINFDATVRKNHGLPRLPISRKCRFERYTAIAVGLTSRAPPSSSAPPDRERATPARAAPRRRQTAAAAPLAAATDSDDDAPLYRPPAAAPPSAPTAMATISDDDAPLYRPPATPSRAPPPIPAGDGIFETDDAARVEGPPPPPPPPAAIPDTNDALPVAGTPAPRRTRGTASAASSSSRDDERRARAAQQQLPRAPIAVGAYNITFELLWDGVPAGDFFDLLHETFRPSHKTRDFWVNLFSGSAKDGPSWRGLACREPAGSLLAACVFAIVDGRLRPGQHFTSDSSLYCPAFAVAPAHRRSGLGRATCAQLLSLANAAQVTRALVTAMDNAQGFWTKQGFAALDSKEEQLAAHFVECGDIGEFGKYQPFWGTRFRVFGSSSSSARGCRRRQTQGQFLVAYQK